MFGSRHLSFTDASSLLSSTADSAADSPAGGLNSRRPSSPLLSVSSEPDIEHSGGGSGQAGRSSSYGGAGAMSGLSAGGMGGEARRVRTRMPLENHAPVAPSEGGVAILRGSLNTDLSSLSAASALLPYTRDFIFPGELLQVVVHRTPIDPFTHPSFSEPPLAELPGEARDSNGQQPYHQSIPSGGSGAAIGVSGSGGGTWGEDARWGVGMRAGKGRIGRSGLGGETGSPAKGGAGPEVDHGMEGGGEGGEGEGSAVVAADGLSAVGALSGGGRVSVGGREDGEVRQQRTRELLEIARRSLYDVHLSEPIPAASRPPNQQQQQQQAGREAAQSPSAYGVMPVPADIAGYDPATAAGLGRRVVSTSSLPNGDVVVRTPSSLPCLPLVLPILSILLHRFPLPNRDAVVRTPCLPYLPLVPSPSPHSFHCSSNAFLFPVGMSWPVLLEVAVSTTALIPDATFEIRQFEPSQTRYNTTRTLPLLRITHGAAGSGSVHHSPHLLTLSFPLSSPTFLPLITFPPQQVLLEVAVSTTALIPDATLEIRQFERFPMPFGPPSAPPPAPALAAAAPLPCITHPSWQVLLEVAVASVHHSPHLLTLSFPLSSPTFLPLITFPPQQVLLEVAVSTTALIPDATLEIRQFERFPMPFGPPSAPPPTPALAAADGTAAAAGDGSDAAAASADGDLLFWLFPLERLPPNSTTPSPAAAARPAIPLPAVATSGWGTPSAFNFTSAAPPTPSVAPSTPVGFSLSLPRVSASSSSGLAAVSAAATTGNSPSNSPKKRTSSTFRDDGGGAGGGGGGTVLGGLAWGTHETGAVGWEGLLSFRGVPLEPQRFSGNCGRLGPFVPGRKWVRGVRVLQPLCVESYTAECGHEDVICVMVENILPREGATAGVILYVDSISLEARSSVSMSLQQSLPVHVARLESGSSKEALPGLPLRPGEQHSFIITPQCSGNAQIVKAPSGANKDAGGRGRRPGGAGAGGGSAKGGPLSGGNEGSSNSLAAAFSFGRLTEKAAVLEEESEGEDMPVDSSPEYSLIISCSCSHTAAQLRYRHPLAWRPRPPRDLLLSISPDNISCSPTSSTSSSSSSLLPASTNSTAASSSSSSSASASSHVHTLPDGMLVAAPPASGQCSRPLTVRVRVTNLTASDLNLTLLAPTTLAATSLSRVCFPTSPRHSSNLLTADPTTDPSLLGQQQPGQGQGQGGEEGSEDEEGLSPPMSPLRVFKSSSLAATLDPPDGSRSLLLPDFLRNRSLHPKPLPSLTSDSSATKPQGISSSGSIGEGSAQNLPVSASGSGGGGGGAGAGGEGGERSVSAAELVAMHVPHRTHLWLQSVVPMGSASPPFTASLSFTSFHRDTSLHLPTRLTLPTLPFPLPSLSLREPRALPTPSAAFSVLGSLFPIVVSLACSPSHPALVLPFFFALVAQPSPGVSLLLLHALSACDPSPSPLVFPLRQGAGAGHIGGALFLPPFSIYQHLNLYLDLSTRVQARQPHNPLLPFPPFPPFPPFFPSSAPFLPLISPPPLPSSFPSPSLLPLPSLSPLFPPLFYLLPAHRHAVLP
ncbi:unnamed protein product [Closterium sp. Naga37s-1]|nr:unnamed protein product [Closterium sp. Naga37s-1]